VFDSTIILPTMEGKHRYLELFFESLNDSSKYNHEILVWCNGCDYKTYNVAKEGATKVFGSSANIGQSIPYNFLVKESSTNLLFFADDDFYFLPNWDFPVSRQAPQFFWMNPMLIESGRPTRSIVDNFGNVENFDKDSLLNKYQDYFYPTIHYGGFMPAFVSKKDYWEIGGYNEDFFIGEADFLYRAYLYYKRNNYIPTTCPNSLIYHFRDSGRPVGFREKQLKMFKYMEDKYKKSIDEIDAEVPWFEVIGDVL